MLRNAIESQNEQNDRVLKSIEGYYETQIQMLKEKINEKKMRDKLEMWAKKKGTKTDL